MKVLVYGYEDLKGTRSLGCEGEITVTFEGQQADPFDQFELVILPYDAFVPQGMYADPGPYDDERDRRNKELEVLIRKGGLVCWLVNRTPVYPQHYGYETLERWATRNEWILLRAYPGFHHLYLSGHVTSQESAVLWTMVDPVRPEFARWVEKWCSTRVTLQPFDSDPVGQGDVLCRLGNDPAGIGVRAGRGIVTFLPYVPGSAPPEQKMTALCELASALLAYRRACQRERPPWLSQFTFARERGLNEQIRGLDATKLDLEGRLEPYRRLKDLLVLEGDALTDAIVEALGHYGLRTERSEQFREDFWLLSAEGKRIAVSEVKGLKANVGRQEVNDADTHRNENGLDSTFPAVVFANTFRTRAKSLGGKDHQVEPDTCGHAVYMRVLVVRTLDLLRLLDQVDSGKVDVSKVTELFTEEVGWLRVADDGTWEVVGPVSDGPTAA